MFPDPVVSTLLTIPAAEIAGSARRAKGSKMNGAEVLDVGRDAIWLTIQL